MSTILSLSELPRDADGIIVGAYAVRQRSGALLEEVGDRAVGSSELARLDAAFGSYITITPADADTAEACARLLFETKGERARPKALRRMFPKPRPAAKDKKR